MNQSIDMCAFAIGRTFLFLYKGKGIYLREDV